MGKLSQSLQFTGTVGDVIAYRLPGSDKIIVRSKGGTTRKQIKTSAAFAGVRRNNAEFSGRASMSKRIMRMLWPQKAVADYNIAGPLNALLKPVQELDTASAWGQRHVQLSRARHLLEGFSLNKATPFDTVLRTSLKTTFVRTDAAATIVVPALLPLVNFFPAGRPYYSMVAVLGVVPDLFFKKDKYVPSSPEYEMIQFSMATTAWTPTASASEEATLTIKLPSPLPDENCSLLLSVGIRYGQVQSDGSIQQVPRAGAAKVLALV